MCTAYFMCTGNKQGNKIIKKPQKCVTVLLLVYFHEWHLMMILSQFCSCNSKVIAKLLNSKAQISFIVTEKLIIAFIFATQIVQFFYFLNPKFPVYSNLLALYRPVCFCAAQFVSDLLKKHIVGFLLMRLICYFRYGIIIVGNPKVLSKVKRVSYRWTSYHNIYSILLVF